MQGSYQYRTSSVPVPRDNLGTGVGGYESRARDISHYIEFLKTLVGKIVTINLKRT